MPLTAEERKRLILAKRGLQRRVAEKLNLSERHVGRCAETGEGSKALKRELAKGLRLPVREVFPPKLPTAGAA